MATHSGVLAWSVPWTEEPGGLPSMGSHGVGHDWVTKQILLHGILLIAYFIKEIFSGVLRPHYILNTFIFHVAPHSIDSSLTKIANVLSLACCINVASSLLLLNNHLLSVTAFI